MSSIKKSLAAVVYEVVVELVRGDELVVNSEKPMGGCGCLPEAASHTCYSVATQVVYVM